MSRIPAVRFIFFLFACLWSTGAYADFGDSCSVLPKVDSSGYLTGSTAYGYLQQNIDMTTNISNGCAQDGNNLRFCIRNNVPSPVCIPIEMKAGDKVKLSGISTSPALGANPLLADIELSAETLGNSFCLWMLTSRGKMPVVCRDYTAVSVAAGPEEAVCQNLGSSCYDGRSKSQSLLSFSGITVYCVRQTLDKVFYTGTGCNAPNNDISFAYLNPFPGFQEALKSAIRAALILYVIFYGFKVVLNHEYTDLNKVAMFIIKFIFVVYFSVGIGSSYDQNGRPVNHNGMTETALPMLLQLTSDFTEIVFLAGGSQGLCNYDPSKYQQGYEFFRVWDAIDCRVGYYLGLQLLYNLGSGGFLSSGSTSAYGEVGSAANFGQAGSSGLKALQVPGILSFFTVMFGFFMAGNIIIVLCGMVFAIVFLSVIFYFLNVYLVSTVTLYVMAYISPIFVPMLLFERTKSYFDSWLKIVISCALQPAVVGGFIALLLTMYDSIFYGNCEYMRHDYEVGEFNFSTFELREPASEPEKCTNSFGYKLVKYYLGQGWEKKSLIIFQIIKVNDIFNLGLSMTYMLIYVFIFYFALQSINEFISDLTGGPSMAGVTVSPTAFMDKAAAAAQKIREATSSKGSSRTQMGAGKGGSGQQEGEARDKASAGKGLEGAADKASKGEMPKEAGASDKASQSEGGGK